MTPADESNLEASENDERRWILGRRDLSPRPLHLTKAEYDALKRAEVDDPQEAMRLVEEHVSRVDGGKSVTLTEFLLARIAEDESAARRVGPTRYYLHEFPRRGTAETPTGEVLQEIRDTATPEAGALFDHNARHQPGRVLAECVAKRDIVSAVTAGWPADEEGWDSRRILKDLALPYADHPDYREGWRP